MTNYDVFLVFQGSLDLIEFTIQSLDGGESAFEPFWTMFERQGMS